MICELLDRQLTFQILQRGIFFIKVHLFSLQECSFTQKQSDINDVTFGNGLFIAVGNDGRISSSLDGMRWKGEIAPIETTLNSVVWANAKFTAVGMFGEILTSPDGINWTRITSNTTEDLYDITFEDNKYVVVGTSGTILNSSDGIKWSKSITKTKNNLKALSYGNSIFVAIGDNGTILISKDGNEWSENPTKNSININSIAWNGSNFICKNDDNSYMTSVDAKNWIYKKDFHKGGKIVYIKDTYIFFEDMTADSFDATILVTKNLENWVSFQAAFSPSQMNAATYGNGKYIIAGLYGVISYSSTAVNWTEAIKPTNSNYYSLTYGNKEFVAAKDNTIIYSSDGVDWKETKIDLINTDYISSIIFVKDKFFAISEQGNILTSKDGRNWTKIIFKRPEYLIFRDIIYANGKFVIVGSKIMTSTDGNNWVMSHYKPKSYFNYISYGNGKFLLLDQDGLMYRTTDFNSWLKINRINNTYFNTLMFANNKFYSINFDKLYSSSDGRKWSLCKLEKGIFVKRLILDNKTLYILSDKGVILSSQNGTDWKNVKTKYSCEIIDLVSNNSDTTVIAGSCNTLIVCTNKNKFKENYLTEVSKKIAIDNTKEFANIFSYFLDGEINYGSVASTTDSTFYAYSNNDLNAESVFYKTSKKSNKKTTVNKDNAQCIHVSGDYIYYINYTMARSINNPEENIAEIVRIKNDGSDRNVLISGEIKGLSVANGKLFYLNANNQDKYDICSADLDGSNIKTLVNDCNSDRKSYTVTDKYIYYCSIFNLNTKENRNWGYVINRVDLSGNNKESVYGSQYELTNINVNNNNIYFISANEQRLMKLIIGSSIKVDESLDIKVQVNDYKIYNGIIYVCDSFSVYRFDPSISSLIPFFQAYGSSIGSDTYYIGQNLTIADGYLYFLYIHGKYGDETYSDYEGEYLLNEQYSENTLYKVNLNNLMIDIVK